MGARGTGTWWCPSFVDEGRQAVAVDLPIDDESAGWWDYADAVVDAVGYRSDLVVVGHSLGGSLRRWSVPASPSTSWCCSRR